MSRVDLEALLEELLQTEVIVTKSFFSSKFKLLYITELLSKFQSNFQKEPEWVPELDFDTVDYNGDSIDPTDGLNAYFIMHQILK